MEAADEACEDGYEEGYKAFELGLGYGKINDCPYSSTLLRAYWEDSFARGWASASDACLEEEQRARLGLD